MDPLSSYLSTPTLKEDVTRKLTTLYNADDPIQLIKDCAQKALAGAERLKSEEVLMPLGFGVLAGLSTWQSGKEAWRRLTSDQFFSGLFYAGVTCFSAYITVYNFNHLANITYKAGNEGFLPQFMQGRV